MMRPSIEESIYMEKRIIPVGSKPKLVNHVWPPLVDFVPRTELMKELHCLLQQKSNYVFVSGIGGSGKTELVKQYVSTVLDEYNDICMINYQGSIKESINKELHFNTEYLSHIQIEEKLNAITREELFLKKMDMLDEIDKCLVVIDNFENIEDEYMGRLLNSNAHVIILTREKVESLCAIDITDKMKVEEEIQLFKRSSIGCEVDEKIIKQLCLVCMKHPLTIVLLAKLVSLNKYETHEILNEFKNKRKRDFEDEVWLEKDRNLKNRRVKEHMTMIVSLYGLSKMQKQLLLDISFSYPKILPQEFFLENHNEFKNDIKLLVKLNLIFVEGERFKVHPLLAECIMEMLSPNITNCQRVLEYFKVECAKNRLDKYCLGVLVNNIATYFQEYDNKYYSMLNQGAKYLYQESEYDASIHVCNYLLRFSKDELEIVQIGYRKALDLKYVGKYEDSIKSFREVEIICEKHPNSIDFQRQLILILIGNGNTYHMLGEEVEKKCGIMKEKMGYVEIALDYYKNALHISKKINGKYSLSCASIYDNLALMYGNIKQFKHAYSNSFLARKILVQLKKRESFDMALCYINLGEIYKLDSKPEKALEVYREANRIKTKVLPVDHASHIYTYSNIGEILLILDRLEEAEEYLIRARDIASLKFTDKHTLLLNIKRQLDRLYIAKQKDEHIK